MYKSMRSLCILALLVTIGGAAVFAATPKIEGTPVPMRSKPDFSSFAFLIGTWQCVEESSRRPRPFNVTQVYSMDSSGYWLIREETTHKASWIPRELKSEAKFTWDGPAKHWVRIVTGDLGGYSVATAPAAGSGTIAYTYVIQAKQPDVASYAPEVYHKVSDTKKTMTTSFTETNGRIVNVKETCTKA